MSDIEFFVPGTPTPQGRPKFVKATGRAYDPAKSRDYKSWVRQCSVEAMKGRPPIQRDIPLCLTLIVYLQRPKTLPKRCVFPTKKPDCSNIQKGIEDAMESICYEADQQITSTRVRKRYGDTPGVLVKIREDKL